MKRISSITEICYSLLGSNTYILPRGVIVHTNMYANGKMDMRVTNANYSEEDFSGKSFGGNYNNPEWYQQHIDYWVKQSEI